MILSDTEIRKHQREHWMFRPFDPKNVQPASYDLKLGNHFVLPSYNSYTGATCHVNYNLGAGEYFPIEPNEFVLATTKEMVYIPPHLVGQVAGKSSWMRLGLQVCNDSGYCDPGFEGTITLELKNLGPAPLELYVGTNIAQLVLQRMSAVPEKPYGHRDLGSHYQQQAGATRSVL